MSGQKLFDQYKRSGLSNILSRSPTWWPAFALRHRLIFWYMTLSCVLVAIMGIVTNYRMETLLNQDANIALKDTYRRFKETAKAIGINSTDKEPLPLHRRLFPTYKLQVEELPFLTSRNIDIKLNSLDTLLKEVRNDQEQGRQFVSDVNEKNYMALKDEELLELFNKLKASKDGTSSLLIDRMLVKYGLSQDQQIFEPYRILVTLAIVDYTTEDLSLPPLNFIKTEKNSPYYITYVGRNMKQTKDALLNLQRTLFSVGIFGIVIISIVIFLITSQALKPLQRVRSAAEDITGQNLMTRIPEPGTKDEVEDLARSLNSMLDRLERSFEAQQRFTSDASHELRTPITAISGHASYLLRRSNPTEAQQESLNIIKQESERLTNLVSNLLQLARSDGGVLQLKREPIFSAMFLNEVASELAVLATAQGSQIQVIGRDIPFEGDQDRLKQVLINLVANSLKAGAQYVRLSSSQQAFGEEIRLTIEDNGPGIPEEHLKKLFDRFYRVEDSRSRDQGGAGLGLSIVKSIVDAHDGRIWIESKVDIGTTAHLQLPIGNMPSLIEEDIP